MYNVARDIHQTEMVTQFSVNRTSSRASLSGKGVRTTLLPATPNVFAVQLSA